MSDKPHWTATSLAFVIVGLLIVIPSGLCSGVFGIAMLSEGGGNLGDAGSILFTVALIGGVPFVTGLLLIYAGFVVRRKGEVARDDDKSP